jgi:hypothetical protein
MVGYILGASLAGVLMLSLLGLLVHAVVPSKWSPGKRAATFLCVSFIAIAMDYLGGGTDDVLIFTPVAVGLWWLYLQWLRKRAYPSCQTSPEPPAP